MRLMAFSDWRVQPVEDVLRFVRNLKNPVDLVVYSGDDLGRFMEEGTNHLADLVQYTTQGRVLIVAGNDDFSEVKKVVQTDEVHDLYENPFVFEGFAFLGLEASTSGPALLRHTEEEVKNHLIRQKEKVKGIIPIVVSHTPPYGTLDMGIRFAGEDGANHIGSTSLRDFVIDNEVKLVLCGHCHALGRQATMLGSALVVNVSSHDSPGAEGNFALIDVFQDSPVNVEWHDTSERIFDSSLLNLHGIGVETELKLNEAGLKEVSHLAHAQNLTEVADESSIPLTVLRKMQLKAKSYLENKAFQIEAFYPPVGDIIFFDIETDVACQRVWLVGVLKDGKFSYFYADHWNNEAEILERFLEFVEEYPRSTFVTYSGTDFDKNVLERALERLKLNSKPLVSRPHVDLCQLIRNCYVFPNQSYALKDIASYLGYKFKHPGMDGFFVALEYHRHIQDRTKLDPIVFEYNEDDVRALPFLVKKVQEIEVERGSLRELTLTEKQKQFREYVEELKQKGIKGEEYRKKVVEWNEQHK